MKATIVKIISSVVNNGQRMVKFFQFGKSDVREKVEVAPYGVDSAPIKDIRGVSTTTSRIGQQIVFGYINSQQVSNPGEFRTYATDSDGNQVFYTYMKNDGTYEVGGNSDFMVRYSGLETAHNQLRDDLNSFINIWNAFAAAYIPGGPSVVGQPATAGTATQSSSDITPAKIEEIKTI